MQASENLFGFESSQPKEFTMEENIILPQEETTAEVVDIQFRPGQKVYYFDPNGIGCAFCATMCPDCIITGEK